MREEGCARFDGVANTAWDTCQVGQGGSPPEVRAQVDDKVVFVVAELLRGAEQ